MGNGTPFTATEFLSAAAFERFDADGGRPATQRRTRNELLVFGIIFTVSGERTIHPTPQHASPAAAHTSARRQPLRSYPRLYTLTCAYPVSLPQVQTDARFDEGEVVDGSALAHRVLRRSPQRAEWRSRSAGRAGCVGSLTPLSDAGTARVRAGLSLPRPWLAWQLSGCVCRRCHGLVLHGRSRGRQASARKGRLAAMSARAIAPNRPAAYSVAHSGGGFWSAVSALCVVL